MRVKFAQQTCDEGVLVSLISGRGEKEATDHHRRAVRQLGAPSEDAREAWAAFVQLRQKTIQANIACIALSAGAHLAARHFRSKRLANPADTVLKHGGRLV